MKTDRIHGIYGMIDVEMQYGLGSSPISDGYAGKLAEQEKIMRMVEEYERETFQTDQQTSPITMTEMGKGRVEITSCDPISGRQTDSEIIQVGKRTLGDILRESR
ncbi:MAG: hypothetical protein ACQESC_03530 [Nanobdellota archaeon]